ncbi:MAG: hypothetical protein CBB71_01830 [Rhodopirellula sp. TMED11]|nr:MAG: hypothetical protein CBB71_01830 [Rhodopirellula sp. TMED11]
MGTLRRQTACHQTKFLTCVTESPLRFSAPEILIIIRPTQSYPNGSIFVRRIALFGQAESFAPEKNTPRRFAAKHQTN